MNNEEYKDDQMDKLIKEVLKEEKQETMNWEFDAFLAQAEPVHESKKVVWYASKRFISTAAAAMLFLAFGIWSVLQTNNSKPQLSIEKNDTKEIKPLEKDIEPIEEMPTYIAKVDEVQVQKTSTKKTYKTKPSPTTNDYNPEYVIVNGEPIYDLEVAKEMTIQSLAKLASNIDKSVSAMENIKHLSIKF